MFPGTWRSAAPQYQRNVNRGMGVIGGVGGGMGNGGGGVTWGPRPLITQTQPRAAPVYPVKTAPVAATPPTVQNPIQPVAQQPQVQDTGSDFLEQLMRGQGFNANIGLGGGVVGHGMPTFPGMSQYR